MDGAGGRKAANHVYTKSDGLTIGSTPGGILASAILGESGVMYDLQKFIFLGSSESESHYSFLSRKEAGWDSLEKLQSATGVRIGSHAVGHPIYLTGRFFAYFLNLKNPKFVTGYSSPEQEAAMVSGEIDARSETSLTVLKRYPDILQKATANLHAVIEIPKGKKIPGFDRLPDLEQRVNSDKERRVLAMFRLLRGAGSPYFVGPGTPKERVQILQDAFRKAYDDPEFQSAYKKATGDDPSPINPEDYQKAIAEIPRDSGNHRAIQEILRRRPAAQSLVELGSSRLSRSKRLERRVVKTSAVPARVCRRPGSPSNCHRSRCFPQ